jgi:hypothetical protein
MQMKDGHALNAESKKSPSGPKSRRTKPASDTITFRLGNDELSALAARASVHKVSIHQYARALLLDALFRTEPIQEIGGELKSITEGISAIRSDLAFTVKTLLMTAGKVSEDEATEWVSRNFNL